MMCCRRSVRCRNDGSAARRRSEAADSNQLRSSDDNWNDNESSGVCACDLLRSIENSLKFSISYMSLKYATVWGEYFVYKLLIKRKSSSCSPGPKVGGLKVGGPVDGLKVEEQNVEPSPVEIPK